MASRRNALRGAALVGALALCILLARHVLGLQAELSRARDFSDHGYIGSRQCKRCHTDHYASFRRTYHATMTQDATAANVLGHFDGSTLDYMGVRARMQRGPAGELRMLFTSGATRWHADVVRSVGSHRFQQYLARAGDEYFRLPVAWDVARGRFMHMNEAFLTPDPAAPLPGGSVARVDYDRHVTRWNDNCVFCHNVRANPGLDAATGRFDTTVAELGVACEACHGPGAEHAARNADPLRRYQLHLGNAPDPTITNPARLPAARSAEVCGRCHGQRITPDISKFLAHGDPFVPGEPLAKYSKPLARDTTQNGEAAVFAARFWRDGTPRLTAYEYQGYLQSACARGGKLSCESCHAMHAGDPSGQLRPGREGDAACTQCHDELAAPERLSRHTRHAAASPGSRCIACHMPNLVYGLASVHLSHRIEVPNPVANAASGRPDACTGCHVDRTRRWASEQIALGERVRTLAPETVLPEVALRLLSGDPIERAIAADALGRTTARYAEDARPRMLGWLDATLASDPYPAVRNIAARSRALLLARGPLPAAPLDPKLAATLHAQAEQAAIEIGE